MSVELQAMNETAFKKYRKIAIAEYAEEHVKAGNWTEDEALQNAEEQYKQLLPDGLATIEHVLFSIVYDDETIGVLWLHVQEKNGGKQAFIYDIKLDENQRGKGFGKQTMQALENYAREEAIKQISLHVFAHNKPAIALYEKMGFEMTDHHMRKLLT